MKKLGFILLAAALVYGGRVYIPALVTEYRISHQARALANEALVTQRGERILLREFFETVERRTGLRLNGGSVILRRRDDQEASVFLKYDIPIEFPFLERTEYKRVEQEIVMTRSRAY